MTAVGEDTYKSLDPGPLKKPSKVLYGPTQQRLNAIGQFTAKITVGSRMCKQTIFVVRGLCRNLMGLPAITSLDVARQIGETIVASNVKEHFPKIFDGLGNLGEEYLIKRSSRSPTMLSILLVLLLTLAAHAQRRVIVVGRSAGRSVCRSAICPHVFSRTVAAVDTKRGYICGYVQRALGTARVWSGVVQEQHVYGGGLKL